MAHIVWLPSVRTNDSAHCTNGDGRASAQTEVICARLRRAEDKQRMALYVANVLADEVDCFAIEACSAWKCLSRFNAHHLIGARKTEGRRRNNSNWLDDKPRCYWCDNQEQEGYAEGYFHGGTMRGLTLAVSRAGVRSTEGTHKRSLWAGTYLDFVDSGLR